MEKEGQRITLYGILKIFKAREPEEGRGSQTVCKSLAACQSMITDNASINKD
ncbi:hypothetical protein [Serratia ureilytica]|uniref:hypothetical protein n=1 Tax=Serratia ureilytica TaxID=300181 RepID=UPI0019CF6149|nr:hypothetical protein [Serratia ureilytica]MBN5215732.1 hypothetical protein [Serratia ureilytica]